MCSLKTGSSPSRLSIWPVRLLAGHQKLGNMVCYRMWGQLTLPDIAITCHHSCTQILVVPIRSLPFLDLLGATTAHRLLSPDPLPSLDPLLQSPDPSVLDLLLALLSMPSLDPCHLWTHCRYCHGYHNGHLYALGWSQPVRSSTVWIQHSVLSSTPLL